MGTQELLRPLPVSDYRDIVVELAAATETVSVDDRLPEVTLLLRTGHSLNGWVLGRRRNERGSEGDWNLLVHLRDNDGGLAYVAEELVAGLVVHEAAAHREILSFGAIEDSDEPPPPRLQIRRRASDIGASLSASLNTTVALELPGGDVLQGDRARRSVWVLLESIQTAITELAERFGASEIADRVRTIRIEQGEEHAVRVDRAGVTIVCDLTKGRRGRFNASALADRLGSAL